MLKAGRNIVRLRGAAGLTQMRLADKLGISYQAVSNWERGTSRPDISKLPELAEIFNVGIDEILGKGKGTRFIGSVLDNTTEDYFQQNAISAEELSEIAPLLQLAQISEAFEHVKESAAVSDLLALAPFLSEELLDECAKQAFEKEGAGVLPPLAPFISEGILSEWGARAYAK